MCVKYQSIFAYTRNNERTNIFKKLNTNKCCFVKLSNCWSVNSMKCAHKLLRKRGYGKIWQQNTKVVKCNEQ